MGILKKNNKMINSLEIHNYQSWKDGHFKFDPGLNVIIGSSDQGKSVIIKALKKLCFNKPGSDSFASWWGGDTLIKLNVNDFVITRIVGKSKNLYLLNKQEFKAFGQGVPEEIERVLKFSDINFKLQADEFFLMNQTPGNVAQYINKIVNLDIIDTAQAKINQRIRKKTSELGFHETQKKEIEGKLSRYNWIKEYEYILVKAEELDKEVIELELNHDELSSYLIDIRYTIEEKERIKEKLKIKAKVDQAISINKEQEKLENEYSNLLTLTEEIEETKEKLNSFTYLESAKVKFKQAEVLSNEINKLMELDTNLFNLMQEIRLVRENKSGLQINLKEKRSEYKKAFPNLCPLCEQEVIL